MQSAESLEKQKSKADEVSKKEKEKEEADAKWRIAEEALNRCAQNQKTHIALVNELRIQVEKCVSSSPPLFSLSSYLLLSYRLAKLSDYVHVEIQSLTLQEWTKYK